MATAYETELERRKNAGFYNAVLKQNKEQAEQRKKLRAPLEQLVAGVSDPQQREQIIQNTIQDTDLYSQIVQDHLKKLDEEAQKAENLEDILNSAPIETLGQSLFYVGLAIESKNGKMKRYNSYLLTMGQLQQAQESKNKEKAEKIYGSAKKLMAEYMLSEEYFDTSNESTKKFLEIYTKIMDEKHYLPLFEQQVQKAVKYVTSKDNADEVRGYVKEVLKDESQRPIFYKILFSPREKE